MIRPSRQLLCPVPQELVKPQQQHWFVKSLVLVHWNECQWHSKKTLEEHISQSLSSKTMDGFLRGCQISIRFGMTLMWGRMLHSFSCLTKLTFHCRVIYYYQLSWYRKLTTEKSFKAEYSTSSILCCLRVLVYIEFNY